jgi:SRSO17 transposase
LEVSQIMAVDGVNPTDLTGGAPRVLSVELDNLAGVVEELGAYHAQFAPLFTRREQRGWAEVYLRGLLTAEVPRKNVEAMVLRLFGAGLAAERTVRALQQFVGEGAWDDTAILATHRSLVAETLGEADGVFIIDGSEIPKQGTHSVGVARQWCGATGKKDNCQAGVFVGYASRHGYTLLDRRLYLPARWFADDHRDLWQRCRIPAETAFHTKHEIAAELVEKVVHEGHLPGRWVVCDEGYGDAPALLDRMAEVGLWYLAEVPTDTMVWPLGEPDGTTRRARPQTWVPTQTSSRKGPVPARERLHPDSPAKVRVDAVAAQIPAANWRRYRILEGSKGPLVADFVAFRAVAVRDKLPGPEVWVLIRRTVSGSADEPTDKFYLSNAPADIPLAELVRVCGMRWPIERCFEEAKSELGLDHYELRFWPGWHHHMTLVLLAHHFLVRLQRRLSPREGGPKPVGTSPPVAAGGLPGPVRDRSRSAPSGRGPRERGRRAHARAGTPAPPGLRSARGAGSASLPPAPPGGCLSLPSQTTAQTIR